MRILSLILAFLVLTACGHAEKKTEAPNLSHHQDPQKNTPPKTPRTEPDTQEPTSEAETEAPDLAKTPETPKEETLTKNNISYPIFAFNEPAPKAAEESPKEKTAPTKTAAPPTDSINKLITVYVDEVNSTYNTSNSSIKAGYDIIHKDERYASILFTGELDGSHYISDFMSTLNIDLKSGNRTQLNQIVFIDGDFIDIVYSELEAQLTSKGADMKELYPHGIEDIINHADTGLGADVHSYFTQSEITLIFKVPHKYGDYIRITVPNKNQAVFD